MAGCELWKVWWLWGIPVAWIATALLLGAEQFRLNGWSPAGDLLDIVRLAVYWFWCRAAWLSSRKVVNPLWTPLARTALGTGGVAHILI